MLYCDFMYQVKAKYKKKMVMYKSVLSNCPSFDLKSVHLLFSYSVFKAIVVHFKQYVELVSIHL